MNHKREHYINQLLAYFDEEKANTILDSLIYDSDKADVDFDCVFEQYLSLLKYESMSKIRQVELKCLEFEEPRNYGINNSFMGFHSSKRKDLRKLHK